MEPVFATLLTAGIGLARDVLAAFRETRSAAVTAPPERPTLPDRPPPRERGIDQATLQKVIAETNRHFENLLDRHTTEIITAMRMQRIKDAVQEVQARVGSLKTLLNSPPSDPTVAMHLVISALNPLQVSLEVARFRLQDNDEHEAWRYCYLIGTSALLAGYAFLEHDASHLAVELQAAMYDTQRSILNAAASRILTTKREIPWENVPHFLSPEGADELLQLYESSFAAPKPKPKEKKKVSASVDEATVAMARVIIAATDDVAELKQMLAKEKRSKYRQGVIDAIEARLRAIRSS